jgi:hypothetical protein
MTAEELADMPEGVGYNVLVWSSLEMQMAIICASAPAMKGFFTGLAKTVTNRYGSRTTGSNDSNLINKPPNSGNKGVIPKAFSYSTAKRASHTSNLINVDDLGYDDAEHWSPNKTSYEMTGQAEEKRMVKSRGILVTETFSVDRGVDSYRKERKVLGI